MISFIIWLIGVILTIKAALEIWKLNGDTIKKILIIVVLVITSWVGLVAYYFFLKKNIPDWIK